jgi:hypothetical protein
MADFQPKAHLRAFTERMHGLLANDLKAIPEDKNNVSPVPGARPALHIVAECAVFNGLIADYLSAGTASFPRGEERETLLRSFDTAEKALTFLDEQTQKLLAAIDALDEDTLGEVSRQPLGRPMSRFGLAEMPATHMMYHDGQLNYIHTLLGDTQMHW